MSLRFAILWFIKHSKGKGRLKVTLVFFSTDKTATDLEVEEKKGGEEDEKGEQSESKLPSSGCPVSS